MDGKRKREKKNQKMARGGGRAKKGRRVRGRRNGRRVRGRRKGRG
jgi:hypothetical protein